MWIEPTLASGSDSHPLSGEQVRAWRDEGAVAVDGVVPVELVATAREAVVTDDPRRTGAHTFGSDGRFVFPSECAAINTITLHPRLLGAVAQLLGTPVRELRLTQSDLWAKCGSEPGTEAFDNTDQRMHVDYPNHTLVHPPAWDTPDAVEVIVYADEVAEVGGATRVVRREGSDDPAYRRPVVGTPGVGPIPWIDDRAHAEAHLADHDPDLARWRAEHLYRRERPVRFRPGTTLLYRHDTWHRGTPLHPGRVRVAHNLTFRLASSEWIATLHPGWAWSMYRPARTMERLVAGATVDQRCVLGFPAPGHPYWTADTLDAVAARYEPLGMDLTEYRRALRG